MMTVWEKAQSTKKPIFLYGTGNGADKVIDELLRLNIKIEGVFASDGFVRKRTFRGFEVKSYGEVKTAYSDIFVLIVFGSSRNEVLGSFKKIAEENETYCVDVPVYGENIFNREFYDNHKCEIEQVRNMLFDEKSKQIFDNIINFKLTGNMDLLFSIETDRKEAFNNILKLSDSENYLDLGAFNGDTVLEFCQNVNSYNNITAVEPDSKNFKRLQANTEHIKNINCINACVSNFCGEIHFSSNGGRNGNISENGKTVKCLTVDEITKESPVTYIKFDVEGQEKDAILGAKETIKHLKSKMLISCYHRSEDIFTLPLLVASIRDDYKIHIRHNPYIPAWDTQFYFV